MADKIQFRRGLKAELPVLSIGEPAFCTDTLELFIGSATGNVLIAKGTAPPAGTAPNVTGLVSSDNTTSAVTLTWIAPTGAVGYNIEKDGVFLTNVTTTSYTVTGLTELTTYTFTIKTVTASGTASGASIQTSTVGSGGTEPNNLVFVTWVGGSE